MKSSDLASWFTAIGTVGTLAVAVLLLYRDRRASVRTQADRIGYYSTIDPGDIEDREHIVTVVNNSDAAVLDVRLSVGPKSYWALWNQYDHIARARITKAYGNNAWARLYNGAIRPDGPDPSGALFQVQPLLPGESTKLTIPAGLLPKGLTISDAQIEVTFRDVTNCTWHRDVMNGRLRREKYSQDQRLYPRKFTLQLVFVIPVFVAMVVVLAAVGMVQTIRRKLS